jgi:hypothetical protein
MIKSGHNIFEPILDFFFDYSLGGYSHRERWACTRRRLFMNTTEMKAREASGIIIAPIGSEFYNSRLNNPNIWYIETVKQGCDMRFSSCVIATKLECHG